MKKTIFTLMVAFGAFTMNAQTLVNFEQVSGTLGGWADANAVVDNPDKTGLNDTEKTSEFTLTPSNWSAAQIDFEAVVLGENTGIEFLVMVDDAGDGVNLADLAFSGFSGTTDPEKAQITESNTWIKMEYEINGAEATDEISNFFAKVNGAGGDAINIYFDEFKYNDFTFSPDQQDPSESLTAGYATGEMIIDGKDLEADYDNAGWGDITKFSMGESDGFEGEYGMLWDETYLYMFFSITDPQVNVWDQEGWAEWKADGMQIYLDAKNRRWDGVASGITGGAINPGRESEEAIAAEKGFQTSYELRNMGGFLPELMQGSEVSGAGYTVEVAWSWNAIANTVMDSADVYAFVADMVKNDYKFAFDIQLNNNTDGDRVAVASWGAADGPYGNSGVWGEVTLAGGPVSVNELMEAEMDIYPNPADAQLTIEMTDVTTVEVYNIIGKRVQTYNVSGDVVNVNTSAIQAGIYVIKATNVAGEQAVSKITIK